MSTRHFAPALPAQALDHYTQVDPYLRCDNPMLPKTSDEDAIPLLATDHQRRPYQAYCVSEAPSRSSSPESLAPSPLRIRKPQPDAGTQRHDEKQWLEDPSSYLTQVGLTIPVHDRQSVLLSESVANCTRTRQTDLDRPPNVQQKTGDTTSAKYNHIARAASPRGSRLLAQVHDIGCNETLLQLPESQSIWWNAEYSVEISDQQRDIAPLMGPQRPLPLLPAEDQDNRRLIFNANTTTSEWRPDNTKPSVIEDHSSIIRQRAPKTEREASLRVDSDSGESAWSKSALDLHGPGSTPSQQGIARYQSDQMKNSTKQVRFSSATSTTRSRRHDDRDSIQPHVANLPLLADPDALNRPHLLDRKALPQSTEVPAGHAVPLSSMSRRKPVRDHVQLNARDLQPVTSNHLSLPQYTSLPSMDSRLGPRPPPWKSFDSLEVERKQRSDARARAALPTYCSDLEGRSSPYLNSTPGDHTTKNVIVREVDEYREQVRSVYPDLAFDGKAVTEEDVCCRCGVM